MCNTIIKNRKWFTRELENIGFDVIPSKANFVFCYHKNVESEELCRKLKEEGILTRHFADED